MRSRRPCSISLDFLSGKPPQEHERMRPATTVQMTLRIPASTIDRIDSLAEDAGLTRAQILRMLLRRASEAELPASLVENAERLRAARGVVA
jgi:antitoxin component of RelBE/YafQ-DinJ toxin-antitoxin module